MAKRYLTIMISLLLAACFETDFPIQVIFDHPEGLEKGGRVLLNGKSIGSVTSVLQDKDGRWIAGLSIRKTTAPEITENSRFVITEDPEASRKMAIEVFQSKPGGDPLPKNSLVKGSTRMSGLLYRMQKDLDSMVDSFKEAFDTLSEELRGIPESQAAKKLEKELEGLYKIMKESSKTGRDRFKEEILPKLKEELDELKKRLDQLGREKEYKTLEIQFEKITRL